MTIISTDAKETFKIGERVGLKVKPGDIIALKGDLGAGKTLLTKGLASALEIKEDVTSPTYNIVCEYNGKLKLNHMDLYRISDIDEFEMLGVDNLLFSNDVTVIEWSERIEDYLPEDIISITMERDPNNENRNITITGMEL